MDQKMGIRLWGLIVLLSVIWGASFFFVEVAVKEVSPLLIVLLRVGIAAFLLCIYVFASKRKMPRDPGIWAAFFIIGALNNVIPFSLIAWGQKHIDSSTASILNAFTPVFSVILAHFLTRDEPLTVKRLAGVVFGWIGVAVLMGIGSMDGTGFETAGQAAVLGAALMYALAAIYGRRFQSIDPVVVSAGMLAGSTIIMIPVCLVFHNPFILDPSFRAWSALFGLGSISTALAYIIYFYVLSKAGATNILLVTFLIPVSAIVLGVAVLGEKPGWHSFAGMALVFTGLAFIDGRLFPGKKGQKSVRAHAKK